MPQRPGFDSYRARKIVKTWLPADCCRCGELVTVKDDWSVDHYPRPQAVLTVEEVNDPSTWAVAHQRCNYSAGGRLHKQLKMLKHEKSLERKSASFSREDLNPHDPGNAGKPGSVPLLIPGIPLPEESYEPIGDRPLWFPWDIIDERAKKAPDSFVPPRIESPHHPDAVGTYLDDFIKHVDHQFMGIRLRAWQLLALARLTEHDSNGDLCWNEAAVSTARQVGKSVLLKAYLWWRITRGPALWGEDQHVVNVANRLGFAHEFWGSVKNWVREDASRGSTYLGPGRETIFSLDNRGRWQPKSTRSGYGFTLAMPVVDEAWDVKPEVVDEMLLPTMLAVRSPQLVITSTAHENATTLFPRIRAAHGTPEAPLLVEWSAPRNAEIDDEDAWRQASPAWTPQRRKFLHRFIHTTPPSAFRAQHMNIWPDLSQRTDDRYTLNGWKDLPHNGDPLPKPGTVPVCVLESTPDLSTFSAVAIQSWHEDEKVLFRVWQSSFGSLPQAEMWAAQFMPGRVVVGLSLKRPIADNGRFKSATVLGLGQKELRMASPLLLAAVREKRIYADHSDSALVSAAENTRVRVTDTGQVVIHAGDGHAPISPIKCVAWGCLDLVMNPATKPKIW